MTLGSHIAYFLKTHIFSLRIGELNVFNLIFWMLVFAGVGFGASEGSVLIGLVLGVVTGILFHALCYTAYVLTRRNEFVADPGATPNGGPPPPPDDSEDTEGPPSVS
jgi:hypothetical protein